MKTNSTKRNQKVLPTGQFQATVFNSIDKVNESDWNSCISPDYPFLRHEFLRALETTGCVSNNSGWVPCHILIRNPAISPNVIGAMPMYLKTHSWGEFIFDWIWADAYQRSGYSYYPKLIVQSPFTPLTSPKLLVAPGYDSTATRRALIATAAEALNQFEVSSIHMLFTTPEEASLLKESGFHSRTGTVEFVWRNRHYTSMEEFLASLSSKKRKNIRQERNLVNRQGISVEVVSGEEIKAKHWRALENFYICTVEKYGSIKYLTHEFFRTVGQSMPDSIVLFLAKKNGQYIGGSVCLQGLESLYGRYWGAIGEFRALHFEVCYYSAIEYCIEQGLSQYNVGVQGEHKLNRGFLPELTYSAHKFANSEFGQQIQNYIEREANQVKEYQMALSSKSPYKEC